MKFKIIPAMLVAMFSIFLLTIYVISSGYSGEKSSFYSDSTISDTTTVTYTCPMHPEITSDKPGQCPKCGMDLVPKKDEKEQGMKCADIEKCKAGGCNMDCCKGNSGGCMNCPMMEKHELDKSKEHNHKSGCKKGCC